MKVGSEVSSTSSPTPSAVPELKIEIWLDNWAEYIGTAAQLQAEGLIPDGFKWPQAAADQNWAAGGFDYWLRRTRPDGHKGPMRSWMEVDNWFVRVRVTGRDASWITRRGLERKAEALRAEFHRHTAAGAREWDAVWRRYWQAETDKHFQKFKTLIPGLVKPKRGRKAKAAE